MVAMTSAADRHYTDGDIDDAEDRVEQTRAINPSMSVQRHGRLGLTVTVEGADDAAAALAEGQAIVAEAGLGRVVAAETLTYDEADLA
jgi:hypothetical protein